MGAGPIPLTEIEAYCRLFSLTDPDDRADLITVIGAMDAEYLAWQGEQSKR